MEVVKNGYDRQCKDAKSGVKYIYLFPFVKYSRSQIITTNNFLNTFPETIIYKFETNGNPILNESQEVDAGGKFFNQSLSFDLVYRDDFENLKKLLKKDYRCIVFDNNGYYRILGLYNGLELGSLNYNTGGGKTELNGFKLDFSGKEERESFFINNLEDAGFIDGGVEFRILESGEFRLTESNEFRILE